MLTLPLSRYWAILIAMEEDQKIAACEEVVRRIVAEITSVSENLRTQAGRVSLQPPAVWLQMNSGPRSSLDDEACARIHNAWMEAESVRARAAVAVEQRWRREESALSVDDYCRKGEAAAELHGADLGAVRLFLARLHNEYKAAGKKRAELRGAILEELEAIRAVVGLTEADRDLLLLDVGAFRAKEAAPPDEGQPKVTQPQRPEPPVAGPGTSRGRESFELEPPPGETLGFRLGVEAAAAHAKQRRAKRPRPKKAAKRKAGAKANVTRPEAAKQYPTSLGRNIDRLRKDCGWSFDELAKKTGIEKKLILAHVNEGTRPQPRIAKLYADAFTKALGRPISASDLEK